MQIVIQHGEATVIEGKSKLMNRPSISKGKLYDKYFIYIPSELTHDSQFPFRHGEELIIKVDTRKKRLIIEKSEEKMKQE